jgi:hypothetical protein
MNDSDMVADGVEFLGSQAIGDGEPQAGTAKSKRG